MRVPVLTYHAANVSGAAYAENDHVALAADLRMIDDLGLRVIPARRLVDAALGRHADSLTGCVVLTCDDATDLDFFDVDYPGHGRQRSFFNILRDFRIERGLAAQPDLQLTAFAVSSAEARATMDRQCLYGRDWMRDSWWRAANASGLMRIENHSFDHNHPCLPGPGPDGMPRGSFLEVTTDARAHAEITLAQAFLAAKLAPYPPRLFCYPFGPAPAWLRDEWLPAHGDAVGLDAAFSDAAAPVTEATNRWDMPRYICGWHWKSPDELAAILRDAIGTGGR